MRDIHQLLPDSRGTKKDQTDFNQYVQLCSADNRHSIEHSYRNGHTHMAESLGNAAGIQRTDHSDLQP